MQLNAVVVNFCFKAKHLKRRSLSERGVSLELDKNLKRAALSIWIWAGF